MTTKPPSEIAREALRQLAIRRLPPTPEHYQALYEEISGEVTPPPFPDEPLRQILHVLPGKTPSQRRLRDQFDTGIAQKNWNELQRVLMEYTSRDTSTASQHLPVDPVAVLPKTMTESLARLVENLLPVLVSDDVRTHEMADSLVTFLRQENVGVEASGQLVNDFVYRLSFVAEDQEQIREGLFSLLHMMFENIAVLSVGDDWLQNQAQALKQASTPPLTLRRIDDLQRRMKDVIFKQSQAHEHTLSAQAHMKEMLATFIDRLAQVDETSEAYHRKLEDCASRISKASSITEITPLLEEVMGATRTMTLNSRMVHDELHALRIQANEAQAQVDKLREELDRASTLARHDALTGVLNRKGLDEAMDREIARSQRNVSPLCIGLLDLDNFKLLNDRYGHSGGDAALQHLTAVIRDVVRPQDQIARYGGEEFILVFPDTGLDSGVEIMRRLQRELTKRYFLQNNERILITFSAGVAQLGANETSAQAIERADKAMYLAKRSGKNRVIAG